MKKSIPFPFFGYLLLFLSIILLSNKANAQSCTDNRYKNKAFDSVIYQDLVYAKDVPRLRCLEIFGDCALNFELGCEDIDTIDLKMHLRMPDTSDTLTKRPVMLWGHGGGFVSGTLENEDMLAMIDTFANKGYVTASYQYRIGADAFYEPSGFRMVYRAMQDASAAIRYLKENAEVFGIDTNYIILGGSSAGAVTALHLAFLDETERPLETYDWSSNTCENYGADLGSIHSHEIEKITSLSPYASTTVTGDGFDGRPDALLPCWGALGDVNWIDEEELLPIYFFHGENDAVVPYTSGAVASGLLSALPTLYGSKLLAEKLDEFGYRKYKFHTFVDEPFPSHEVWGVLNGEFLFDNPNENWDFILNEITDFTYDFLIPEQPILQGDEAVLIGRRHTYMVSNPQADATYCWGVVGGTIVSNTTDSESIEIEWGNTSNAAIYVRTISCNGVESLASAMNVSIADIDIETCTDKRYNNQIFDNIQRYDNVAYSLDAQAMIDVGIIPQFGIEAYFDNDLKIDIVAPQTDTLSKRPAILFAHSGGYTYPPVGGTKENDDMQAWIDTFARKGYVAAALEYRVGIDVTDQTSAERAVYRAAQDVSAAVRYLKLNAEILKIDTGKVFVVGSSAGAIAAIHACYLEANERNEYYQSTYTQYGILGTVIADNIGGLHSRPIERITSLSPYTSTTANGNISPFPAALISLGGAIGNLNLINALPYSPPIFMIHGGNDNVVSPNCAEPYDGWLNMPVTCGSAEMAEAFSLEDMEHELYIYPNEADEFWSHGNGGFGFDNVPNNTDLWQDVTDKISNYIYKKIKPIHPIIVGNENVCLGDTEIYEVTLNEGSQYCWEVSGGTIVNSSEEGNAIAVLWENNGVGALAVRETNCNVAESELAAIGISIINTPTALNVTNISATSATLSWVGNSLSYFSLRYRPISGGDWIETTTYNNEIILPNLEPNTNYEYQVQAFCSENTTTDFAASNFSTIGVLVRIDVLLEGAFNLQTNLMKTYLRTNNLLPLSQPYDISPWNYDGNESFASINDMPTNAVDWILVEIYEAETNVLVQKKAGILLDNGRIVEAYTNQQINGLIIDNIQTDKNYNIVVRHRNHIDIVSSRTRRLPFLPYSFMNNANQAKGNHQLKQLENSNFVMIAGDIDPNQTLTTHDLNVILGSSANNIYANTDSNFDGNVNFDDVLMYYENASHIGFLY